MHGLREQRAIIIYLRIANVFARFYSSWTTILIESCMSGAREERALKEEKEIFVARAPRKNYEERVSRFCLSPVYLSLFEIYDNRPAVPLSFNKASR